MVEVRRELPPDNLERHFLYSLPYNCIIQNRGSELSWPPSCLCLEKNLWEASFICVLTLGDIFLQEGGCLQLGAGVEVAW